MYQGTTIRLSAKFSAKLCRLESGMVFKVLRGKNCQPKILYPAKLSFGINGEIKSFPDKEKLNAFVTIRSALKGMLKGVLQDETKEC